MGDDEEQRERGAVYNGWRQVRTLEEVEELERLVDRYAARNPGPVDQSDAAIAREMLKMRRRSTECHGKVGPDCFLACRPRSRTGRRRSPKP